MQIAETIGARTWFVRHATSLLIKAQNSPAEQREQIALRLEQKAGKLIERVGKDTAEIVQQSTRELRNNPERAPYILASMSLLLSNEAVQLMKSAAAVETAASAPGWSNGVWNVILDLCGSDLPVKDITRLSKMVKELKDMFALLQGVKKAVSIFGSARLTPDDPHYIAAENTAFRLGRRGWTIVDGGGPGVMEAASKGAKDAGGLAVGMSIVLPHEQGTNPHVDTNLNFNYMFARKIGLVMPSKAYMAFKPGFGTLDELFEILTLIKTGKMDRVPVVLYGKKVWKGLDKWFRKVLLSQGMISRKELKLYRIVNSPEDAVEAVERGL